MPIVSRSAWLTAISNLFVVNNSGDIEADEVLAQLTDLADSNPFDPTVGFVVPNSAPIPFADNAARDTWAAANLGDLIQNQTLVEVTGTPNVWYLWTGGSNPPSHDNSFWADVTPVIRGSQGVAGADGTDGTNGTNGTDGAEGPEGPVGPEGPQGPQGLPGGTAPRILGFTSSTLTPSVTGDTQLSGSQTFTFTVEDPAEVEGNLTLSQAGAALATDIAPTAGTTTQTINTITLAAGETVAFTLTGTSTAATGSRALSATFTVRAHLPEERAYSYVQSVITAGTQDLTAAGVSEFSVTAVTGSYRVQATLPTTDFLVIEYPANRPITAIEAIGIEVDLTTFPEQVGVRTIGSVTYNARTNQNNAAQALPVDYVVRY